MACGGPGYSGRMDTRIRTRIVTAALLGILALVVLGSVLH